MCVGCAYVCVCAAPLFAQNAASSALFLFLLLLLCIFFVVFYW